MFPVYNGCPVLAFPLPVRTHGRQNQQPIKTPAVGRRWHMAAPVNAGKKGLRLGTLLLSLLPPTANTWMAPTVSVSPPPQPSFSLFRAFPFWRVFRFLPHQCQTYVGLLPICTEMRSTYGFQVKGPCPRFHGPRSLDKFWQDFISKGLFSLI